MARVNIYLTFNGNCEEAFHFYKSVFGGEFPYMGRFNEMPADAGYPLAPEDANRIMHVSLPISNETTLMGSDTAGESSKNFKQGNNFSISVLADTTTEADILFNKLAVGGQITMPLNNTFWGSYFGMLTDRFGISWQMNVDLKK